MRGWFLLGVLLVGCDPSASEPAFRRGDEADDPAAGFVAVPDAGGSGFECNPGTQTCDEDEKCVWYSTDNGPSWNGVKCVPVDAAAVQVGDPCTVVGTPTSGVDDCPRGSMCWFLDAQGVGVCATMCVGAWGTECVDPDERCVQDGEGLGICYPACDPVDPSVCGPGEGCYPISRGMVCAPDASGRDGAQGDGCEFVNDCDPGTLCAGGDALDGCTGTLGCCTAVCDLNAPSCPDGLVCTPYYDGSDPESVPGLEHVGVCLDPV
mgnify:CR=1 FL=1